MPDLIRFVHGSSLGLLRIVKEFRQLWGAKKASKMAASDGGNTLAAKETPSAACGKENVDYSTVCGISKRQLESKIQQIAKKESRPPDYKHRFYVHRDILDKYGLDPAALAVVAMPVSVISPFSRSSGNQNVHPPPPGAMQTPTRKRAAVVDVSPECFGAKPTSPIVPVGMSYSGLVGVSPGDPMGAVPVGVDVSASGAEVGPAVEELGASMTDVTTSESVAAKENELVLPPEKRLKVEDQKPELLA